MVPSDGVVVSEFGSDVAAYMVVRCGVSLGPDVFHTRLLSELTVISFVVRDGCGRPWLCPAWKMDLI